MTRPQADPPLRVHAYFQHMPPTAGATAMRAASIMRGLLELLADDPSNRLRVYTTTPDPTPVPGLEIEALAVPEVENIESLMTRVLGELRTGWVAGRRMFDRTMPCDLAVISTPGYLAALIACWMARRRGVPYVLELRDVYPQVYAEAGLIRKSSWLYRFFRRRSLRMYQGARLVIAATRGLAHEVSIDSPAARVTHVYNGFPASLLNHARGKSARFTVCFHGVLGFFQDVDTLIEVARELAAHDVDVEVVGYGRKAEQIQRSGLANLHFHGRLSFEQTMAIVQRCHVGLSLRLDEGISKDAFPVKVWEYLGSGMPSIVTPACEAGAFLEHNGCGYQLASGATRAVVERLLWLKDHPGELAAMSTRCRQVAAQYTRERTGLEAATAILRG